jgi:hypothetical protein
MRRLRRSLPVSMAVVLLGGLLSITASAEEPSADAKPAPAPAAEAHRGTRPGDVQKVFVLRHVRADDMAQLLSVFPAEIRHVSHVTNQLLSVSAGPAVAAAIEETIKRLDVPPPPAKSVDVTGYILECSAQAPEAGATPTELQDAVAQLRGTFGYAGCSLAQLMFARTSDRAGFTTSSRLKTGGTATMTADVMALDTVGSPIGIRFDHFHYGVDGTGIRLAGNVDVRDGQRVILGKLGSTEGGKDQILVLTAKVVN